MKKKKQEDCRAQGNRERMRKWLGRTGKRQERWRVEAGARRGSRSARKPPRAAKLSRRGREMLNEGEEITLVQKEK